jgi:hypothetical protein
VAEWISTALTNQPPWVVTSWSPTTLEAGFQLAPVFSKQGVFPTLHSKSFFPAVAGARTVNHHVLQALPLGPGPGPAQDKMLDGSPIGLRGPWGEIRNGATWTRQGSGIIGPVPLPGMQVEFEAECSWPAPTPDWPEQILRVYPPWGGAPLRLVVQSGSQRVRGTWVRPAGDRDRGPTGVYGLSVVRPYDPAEFGMHGYAPDLGVLIRRIIIRIEPDGPPVSQ